MKINIRLILVLIVTVSITMVGCIDHYTPEKMNDYEIIYTGILESFELGTCGEDICTTTIAFRDGTKPGMGMVVKTFYNLQLFYPRGQLIASGDMYSLYQSKDKTPLGYHYYKLVGVK